jgi:hypothetical protein
VLEVGAAGAFVASSMAMVVGCGVERTGSSVFQQEYMNKQLFARWTVQTARQTRANVCLCVCMGVCVCIRI